MISNLSAILQKNRKPVERMWGDEEVEAIATLKQKNV